MGQSHLPHRKKMAFCIRQFCFFNLFVHISLTFKLMYPTSILTLNILALPNSSHPPFLSNIPTTSCYQSRLTCCIAHIPALYISSPATELTCIVTISVIYVQYKSPSVCVCFAIIHPFICDLVSAVVLKKECSPSFYPSPKNRPRCSSKCTTESEGVSVFSVA